MSDTSGSVIPRPKTFTTTTEQARSTIDNSLLGAGVLAKELPEEAKSTTVEITGKSNVTRAGGEAGAGSGFLGGAANVGIGMMGGILDAFYALPNAVGNAIVGAAFGSGAIPEKYWSEDYRDTINKIANAGDYETMKILIPGLLAIGQGEKVGMQSTEGRVGYAGGMGIGAELTAAGMMSNIAKQLPIKEGGDFAKDVIVSAGNKASSLFGATKAAGAEALQSFVDNPAMGTAIGAGVSGLIGGASQTAEEIVPGSKDYVAIAPAGLMLAPAAVKGVASMVFEAYKYISPFEIGKKLLGKAVGTDATQEVVDLLPQNLSIKDFTAMGYSKQQARILAQASNDAAQAEAARTSANQTRIRDSIGKEIELSIPETTLDPSLLVEQRNFERQTTGMTTVENLQRKIANLLNLDAFRTQKIADAEAHPSVIFNTLTNKYNRVMTIINKQGARVEDTLDALTGKLPFIEASDKVGFKRSFGRDVRAELIEREKIADLAVTKAAKRLGINERDPLANAQPMKDAINAQLKIDPENTGVSYGGLPKSVRRFLEFDFNAKGKEGKINFQDWKEFRSQIASELRESTNDSEIRHLSILASALDNSVKFVGNNAAGKARQEFAEFYLNTKILPFSGAVVKKIMKTAPGGGKEIEYHLADEDVAAAFTKSSSDVRTYRELFGDDPVKMDMFRDAVLDEVATKAITDGKLSKTALSRFINTTGKEKYGEVVITDPTTKEPVLLLDYLSDVAKTQDALLARRVQLKARKDKVSEFEVTSLLDEAGYRFDKETGMITADGKPHQAQSLVNNAVGDSAGNLKDPANLKRMWEIVQKSGDDDAKETFKNMVFRSVISKDRLQLDDPGVDAIANNAVRSANMLERYKDDIFLPMMGKEHFDNAMAFFDLTGKTLTTGMPEGKGIDTMGLMETIQGKIGLSPRGITTQVSAVNTGRQSSLTAAVFIIQNAVRQNMLAGKYEALKDAILNPSLARVLSEPLPINQEGGRAILSQSQMDKISRALYKQGINPDLLIGAGVAMAKDAQPSEERKTTITMPILRSPSNPAGASSVTQPSNPEKKLLTPLIPPIGEALEPPPAAAVPTKPKTSYELLFPNDSLGKVIEQRAIGQ